MPNPPTATITLPNVASAEDVTQLRRELVEIRKLVEAMQGPATREILDRAEAADYLGISTSTLDGLDVPKLKIGAAVRFRRASLDEWAIAKERAA